MLLPLLLPLLGIICAAGSGHLANLQHRKAVLGRLLARSRVLRERTALDYELLQPGSMVFEMRPRLLAEYSRLCSTVSEFSRSRAPLESAESTITIAGREYERQRIFLRGNNQLSGVLWASQHDGLAHLVVAFAGTSSTSDVVHWTVYGQSSAFGYDAHCGITILALHSLGSLNDMVSEYRSKGHRVDMLLSGHSLGGTIALLAIYDLKAKWAHDANVRIRCLNFAGPSPFKKTFEERINDIVGYNNILNVHRRADYVYQSAEALRLLPASPTVFLEDRLIENLEPSFDGMPWHRRIKSRFGHNHYITEFAKDLADHEDDRLWHELELLEDLVNVEYELALLLAE